MDKIAEIVCRAACEFESPESRVACRKRCNGGGCVPMIEAKQAILALIEQEQAKQKTTRWYIAKKHYDDGVETQEDRDILSGEIDSLDCAECMKQAKESIREELEAKYKPMVEALQRIVSEGDYTAPEGMKRIAKEALAKIDAVLEGDGK